LDFWASSEIYQPASAAETAARRSVEPYLNAAFEKSRLKSLQGTICYVPIIMPTGMQEQYPARSKLNKDERIYDCAPQLNYDVFIEGSSEEQLREYIRGIAEAGLHLIGIGATPEQVDDFNKIIAKAVDNILAKS
jgi:hypothetical protein